MYIYHVNSPLTRLWYLLNDRKQRSSCKWPVSEILSYKYIFQDKRSFSSPPAVFFVLKQLHASLFALAMRVNLIWSEHTACITVFHTEGTDAFLPNTRSFQKCTHYQTNKNLDTRPRASHVQEPAWANIMEQILISSITAALLCCKMSTFFSSHPCKRKKRLKKRW